MKKELVKQLVDRFGYIINEENIGLQWGYGIDVADGWYNLIYELFEKIEGLYKEHNKDISEFKVIQIKEKYAELRIYVRTEIREVHDLIDEYEGLSRTVCEECGDKGSIHNKNGYILTLCKEHARVNGFVEYKRER